MFAEGTLSIIGWFWAIWSSIFFLNGWWIGIVIPTYIGIHYAITTAVRQERLADLPWDDLWPFFFTLLGGPVLWALMIFSYVEMPINWQQAGPTALDTRADRRVTDRTTTPWAEDGRDLDNRRRRSRFNEEPEDVENAVGEANPALQRALRAIEENHSSVFTYTKKPSVLDYEWEGLAFKVKKEELSTGDGMSFASSNGQALLDAYSAIRGKWLSSTLPDYIAALEDRIEILHKGNETAKAEHREAVSNRKRVAFALAKLQEDFEAEQAEFLASQDDSTEPPEFDNERYKDLKRQETETRDKLARIAREAHERQEELGRHTASLRELQSHMEDGAGEISEIARSILQDELLKILKVDGVYALGVSKDGFFEVRMRKSCEYLGEHYDLGKWAVRFGNPAWPYPKFKLLDSPTRIGVRHPYFHYFEGSDFCIGNANQRVKEHMVNGRFVALVSLVSATLGHVNDDESIPGTFKLLTEREWS